MERQDYEQTGHFTVKKTQINTKKSNVSYETKPYMKRFLESINKTPDTLRS